MKLLRLVTTNENALFDNTFNEDIVLKPNSKMALQSVSIETENNVIEINSNNDEITAQYSTGYDITAQLSHGTYNVNNYTNLFNDIQNKLNEKVGYDATSYPVRRSFGLEWNCETNTKKQVEIRYKIGTSDEYFTPTNRWNYDAQNVRRFNQAGRVVWERIDAGSGDNESSCLFDTFLSRGCGYIRVRTHKYEANLGIDEELNGYIIGLSETNISELNPDEITDAMLNYGIAVTCNSANTRQYYTVSNGNYTLSAIAPNFNSVGDVDNDFQEVIINFNKIEFNVYQNGDPAKVPLSASVNYTSGQKLYPFFLFRAENASLNSLRVTPSGFGAVTDANRASETELFAPPQQQRNPSDNTLTFKAQSLADFLGYFNTRQPQNGTITAVEHNFTANNVFKITDIADAFLVELLNLKCESYDGLLNQRKNILAVIPKSNQDGEIIYETNTPFFIDLNNANDILLRNLRLRVVRPDYSTISILGTATIVLLVDDGSK